MGKVADKYSIIAITINLLDQSKWTMPPMNFEDCKYTQLIIPTALLEPWAKLLKVRAERRPNNNWVAIFMSLLNVGYINITNIECIPTRKHFSVDLTIFGWPWEIVRFYNCLQVTSNSPLNNPCDPSIPAHYKNTRLRGVHHSLLRRKILFPCVNSQMSYRFMKNDLLLPLTRVKINLRGFASSAQQLRGKLCTIRK